MFERPETNETKLFTMEISSTQLGRAFSEVLEVSISSIWSIGLIPSCSLGATMAELVLIGRYSHLQMKLFGMDRLDELIWICHDIFMKAWGGSSSPPNHGDSCPPKRNVFFLLELVGLKTHITYKWSHITGFQWSFNPDHSGVFFTPFKTAL